MHKNPLTDQYKLGPFDLAKQMGVERGGEEHEAAIARIKKAAQENGKTAAMFCKLSIFKFDWLEI